MFDLSINKDSVHNVDKKWKVVYFDVDQTISTSMTFAQDSVSRMRFGSEEDEWCQELLESCQ